MVDYDVYTLFQQLLKITLRVKHYQIRNSPSILIPSNSTGLDFHRLVKIR